MFARQVENGYIIARGNKRPGDQIVLELYSILMEIVNVIILAEEIQRGSGCDAVNGHIEDVVAGNGRVYGVIHFYGGLAMADGTASNCGILGIAKIEETSLCCAVAAAGIADVAIDKFNVVNFSGVDAAIYLEAVKSEIRA